MNDTDERRALVAEMKAAHDRMDEHARNFPPPYRTLGRTDIAEAAGRLAEHLAREFMDAGRALEEYDQAAAHAGVTDPTLEETK